MFYSVSCPSLTLENGEVDYNTHLLTELLYYSYHLFNDDFLKTGYSVGTMASFSCDEFYSREGSNSVICQSTGNWSLSTPICNASNDNES